MPSYRTSNFLDPKARGLTTGVDAAGFVAASRGGRLERQGIEPAQLIMVAPAASMATPARLAKRSSKDIRLPTAAWSTGAEGVAAPPPLPPAAA